MDASQMYTILLIVGSFLTLTLGINAFFLKGIYDRVGTVEIGQATIIANSLSIQKEINELRNNQKEIFSRLNLVEREVLK